MAIKKLEPMHECFPNTWAWEQQEIRRRNRRKDEERVWVQQRVATPRNIG